LPRAAHFDGNFVLIPTWLQRLPRRTSPSASRFASGIAIAVETVRALRALPGVNGVHVYSIEWPEAVALVARDAGLLPRPTVKEVATA